jgi:hypothetical protein
MSIILQITFLYRRSQVQQITITLDEVPMSRLRELADEAGVSPEEMLCASAEQWLAEPRDDFSAAVAYVLRKNSELHRRLA